MSTNKKLSSMSVEEQRAVRLKELERNKRRMLSDLKFGAMKTVADLQRNLGWDVYDYAASEELTKPIILQIFQSREDKIKNGELDTEAGLKVVSKAKHEPIVEPTVTTEAIPPTESTDPLDKPLECLRHNPHVRYLPFQDRASREILRKILRDELPAILLQAQVGSGKTFMYGAIIRYLYDSKWEKLDRSFSPYPVTIITKATVVEQTIRVLRDSFGLEIGTQVDVTNIDQLRSKFGEQFINEETIVVGGLAQIVYRWKPLMIPALLILDECQSVKNIQSQQSRIIQALFDVPEEYRPTCIFTSATPFTRPIETKCFVVATQLEFV